MEDLLDQRLVVGVRQEEGPQDGQDRHPGPRRPRAPGVRAEAPNQLWLADITEHPTGEGKLYLCAIKDAFSNRIVGYSIDAG